MAFRVRYVPLSPQSSMPRAKASDLAEPFQFVPLSQDMINTTKQHFDDLINELCSPLPTLQQFSYGQSDLSAYASTSTSHFNDMQLSAPVSRPDLDEQQDYFSFLEQNQEPEPSSDNDFSDVQMNMDTTMEELASFSEGMTWNFTDDQLLALGSWDIFQGAVLAPEVVSELDTLLAATSSSELENLRKQVEELEREFNGAPAPIPSESSEESK